MTHDTRKRGSCRQKLGIQRTFTLGDFESALIDEYPADFVEEAIVRLLKAVYHNDPTASRVSTSTATLTQTLV
jgi:hypothetical protein